MRIASFALVWLLCLGVSPAWSTVEFEDYCGLADVEPALRQTIIILDEHHITPEKPKQLSQANQSWRRFVGDLLDTRRTGLASDFLPRERVTILVARQDGAGVTREFTACLPFFSEEEKRQIGSRSGVWKNVNDFFGSGTLAKTKKDADRFVSMLASSLVDASQADRMSAPSPENRDFIHSGLLASLKRTRIVNLANGVPRIILFSDLTRFDFGALPDATAARTLGLKLGEDAQLDLDRAELYVTSASSSGPSDMTREVMHSFFLQSRSRLMGLSAAGTIGNLSANPVSVSIFQGEVRYPNGAYPMRMRLAVDRNGSVVNSWISVQSDIERFTPFSGALTCDRSSACRFIGDKVFAQIWTKNPDPKPEFEAWMPFAGVRELEFELSGESIVGKAFDSAADIKGAKDNQMKFDLRRLKSGTY